MYNADGALNDTRAVQIGSGQRLDVRARRPWQRMDADVLQMIYLEKRAGQHGASAPPNPS